MTTYREFHRRSIEDKEGFWAEQAKLVHWKRPPGKVLDYRRPPFARWFVGGETNLCYNALDRHLGARGEQKALVYISTETGEERSFSYRELHLEVQRAAAMLQSLGVGKGDRVVVYMPMIPEAVFVILGCARIGAIDSVVFGWLAAARLAARIGRAVRHPVYGRNDRQGQGRAARRRGIRRRARGVGEAYVLRRRRGDDVHHLGHRLGGGTFLHHLRSVDRRHDDDPVRGRPGA